MFTFGPVCARGERRGSRASGHGAALRRLTGSLRPPRQTPYLHFLVEMARAFPSRPMVLLEAPHVSVGLSADAVGAEAVAGAAAAVLAARGWRQAAVVGHSYGTFVCSHLLRLHRPLVQSMARALFIMPPPKCRSLCPCSQVRCKLMSYCTEVAVVLAAHWPPDSGTATVLGVQHLLRWTHARPCSC